MKKTAFVLLFCGCFLLFPLKAAAAEASEIIIQAGGSTETETTQNVFLHGMSLIFSSAKQNGRSILACAGGLLAVMGVAGVFSALKNAYPALGSAGDYISVLTLSVSAFTAVTSVTHFVQQATLRFSEYLLTLTPVMTAMYAYGGSAGGAVASAVGVNMFCTVVTVICNTVLTPLINMCLILSLTSALPECSSVQPIANGIKNLAASLTAFVFSLLGFAVSMQTVIATAADTYTSRTVRFAAGVFIPVIGNMVGEAGKTVVAAVGKAKSVVGLGGITVLLGFFIPPVIVVILYKLCFLMCGSIAKMLGCEKESRLLYDINGIFGILLAVMLGSSLVGLLAFAVFICTGVK